MKKKSWVALAASVAALTGAAVGAALYLKKKQDEAVETVDLEILDDQLEQDAEEAAEDVEDALDEKDLEEPMEEDEEEPVDEPMEEDEEPEDAQKMDE